MIEAKIKEDEKKKETEGVVPTTDALFVFVSGTPSTTLPEIRVFNGKDGSKLLVPLDGIGRPALNTTLYIQKDVVAKLIEELSK